jgi:hypothetical protein
MQVFEARQGFDEVILLVCADLVPGGGIVKYRRGRPQKLTVHWKFSVNISTFGASWAKDWATSDIVQSVNKPNTIYDKTRSVFSNGLSEWITASPSWSECTLSWNVNTIFRMGRLWRSGSFWG